MSSLFGHATELWLLLLGLIALANSSSVVPNRRDGISWPLVQEEDEARENHEIRKKAGLDKTFHLDDYNKYQGVDLEPLEIDSNALPMHPSNPMVTLEHGESLNEAHQSDLDILQKWPSSMSYRSPRTADRMTTTTMMPRQSAVLLQTIWSKFWNELHEGGNRYELGGWPQPYRNVPVAAWTNVAAEEPRPPIEINSLPKLPFPVVINAPQFSGPQPWFPPGTWGLFGAPIAYTSQDPNPPTKFDTTTPKSIKDVEEENLAEIPELGSGEYPIDEEAEEIKKQENTSFGERIRPKLHKNVESLIGDEDNAKKSTLRLRALESRFDDLYKERIGSSHPEFARRRKRMI